MRRPFLIFAVVCIAFFSHSAEAQQKCPNRNTVQELQQKMSKGEETPEQESTEDLEAMVKAFAAEDAGENVNHRKFQGTSRTVGVGSQILADLGIEKMRLMSRPKKYHALSGFHLEVVDYVEPQS